MRRDRSCRTEEASLPLFALIRIESSALPFSEAVLIRPATRCQVDAKFHLT